MKRSFLSTSLGLLLTVFFVLVAHAEKTPFDLKQLRLPEGFHIAVFADNIDSARMLTFTPGGVLLVSESGEGKVVALPDPRHTGKADRTVNVISGLNEPHGIAFYQGKLYVAENDKVRRYDWDETNLRATNPKEIVNLPTGGGHSTRSLLFNGGKINVTENRPVLHTALRGEQPVGPVRSRLHRSERDTEPPGDLAVQDAKMQVGRASALQVVPDGGIFRGEFFVDLDRPAI